MFDPISATKSFISFLWNGDMNTCRALSADDFTFVGPFEHSSDMDIAHFVDFRVKLNLILERLSYEIDSIEFVYGDTHTAITTADMEVWQDKGHIAMLRSTLVWRITANGHRLAHLHMSVPIKLQPDSSHNSASEFIDIVPALSSEGKPLIMKDSSSKTHLVNLAETSYLEAQHQYTMIYTMPEPFRVRESLTNTIGRFPSYFVRVHRSYAVNAFLASSISQDAISLKNGEEVPIPAKRAAAVRKLVLSTISEALSGPAASASAPSDTDAKSAERDRQRETPRKDLSGCSEPQSEA